MSIDTECYEKVGLRFSARALPKLKVIGAPDPFLAVYVKDNKTGHDKFLGHTAVLDNQSNPDFADELVIDYYFEEVQEVTIKVYDHAGGGANTENLALHALYGEIKFPLSKLMRGGKYSANLTGDHPSASVAVRGEAVKATRDIFCAVFHGHKLKNQDGFFATSDPFLQIQRQMKDGSWIVVWRNEKVDNNLSPTWPAARIPMMTLCNANIDCPLRFNIFDFDHTGNHKPMGSVETTVRNLLAHQGNQLSVTLAGKEAGHFSMTDGQIERHPTFSDYILGGCEVSLTVAIDFTGSNGNPVDVTSLHYVGSGYNEYQRAIRQVGSIVEPYDTDKKVSVYGFGAKCSDGNGGWTAVQHAFPVYGGGYEVTGIDGILQAYKDCVHNVALSGPTYFAPIVNAAAGIAAAANVSQANQKYHILLIIADGVINDEDETLAALRNCASLPLSVIIIGVGSADFSDMKNLDEGARGIRDITNFVAMREYAGKPESDLGKEVLAEIPGQLLAYFKNRNIMPNAST